MNILFLICAAEVIESSSAYSSSRGSKSVTQASSEAVYESASYGAAGAITESHYESSAVRGSSSAAKGKSVSITEVHGDENLTSSQISRTLNTSSTDKSGSIAVAGGKPFFAKPLHGLSIERKLGVFFWS